ncbi:MAG: ribonuclease P protein component [Bacteroidales bacterium]|nr:ribonuclease P protein component [Bacteroidales bacterium]
MFSFPKKERLCNKKKIDSLFSKGKAFLCYPFSVKYLLSQGDGKIQILIVCSKRYQKKAVSRNYIKRRMREAYRLNNSQLKNRLTEAGQDLFVSLSYISKDLSDYHFIEKNISDVLKTLESKVG